MDGVELPISWTNVLHELSEQKAYAVLRVLRKTHCAVMLQKGVSVKIQLSLVR